MDTGESWELFDLDTELHVAISDDAKDYLRQFGLEEYNFENYQPSHDPGSYFKDVPREQNPEALFDDLTRESIRRNSGRSNSWTSRPALANGRAPSSKLGHEKRSTVTVSRHDLPQPPKPPDGATKQRPPPRVDSLHKNVHETPKTPPKRVSFTEEIEIESPKPKENADLHQKHSKTMTSFFGRPKVKGNKKTNQKQESIQNVSNAQSEDLEIDSPPQQNKIQHQGKTKNNIESSNQKKGKKFKFPAFDMMRHRKSSGGHPQGSEQKKPDDPSPPTASTSNDSTPKSVIRSGIQTLDLISNSPELPEPNHQEKAQQIELESDMDTLERRHYSDHKSPEHRAEVAGDVAAVRRVEGMNGNIVEMVSFHQELGHGGGGGDEGVREEGLEGILVGEHLHPVLLAALKGDLNTLESLAQLSAEGLLKVQDDRGSNVLHTSAASGQIACMEYICQYCPLLVTTENKTRLTPAAMAIKHGKIESLDWLLEHLNLRQELLPSTARRRCLLHHAAKFGQDGCLRLLLSKLESLPSDFSCSDQHGNTPAHMAAKYGHILCLQTLVEYGFNVCSSNQYGHTPCYYADFNNHRHCAGYLMVVETCAQLARYHVIQSKHSDWLASRNEAICGFTSETLRLSSSIARQSAEDVDVTYRLQQTLDDAMDLVGDVTTQLKHVHEKNTSVHEANNNSLTTPGPGKEAFHSCVERALDLQRRLEGFDGIINHQTARQQILRVKDVQRRWEGLVQREPISEDDESEEQDIQVQQLLRDRFSGAVQRLLVYRTTQDGTKNLIPSSHNLPSPPHYSSPPGPTSTSSPHHPSPPSQHYYSHPPPPTTPSSQPHSSPRRPSLPPAPATPSSRHPSSPPSPHHYSLPPPPTSPSHHPTTSSPKHSPTPTNKNRLTSMDPISVRLEPTTSPSRKNKEDEFLLRLSPRARGSEKKNKESSQLFTPDDMSPGKLHTDTSNQFKVSEKRTKVLPQGGSIGDISFDRSSTSSSTSSSNMNTSSDKLRQNMDTKNNVVESFLKDRIFYNQDPENPGAVKKVQNSAMFYAGKVPSAPSSSASSDSPGLKFSEFSAFNRVSNRGVQGDGSVDTSSSDSRGQDMSRGSIGQNLHKQPKDPETKTQAQANIADRTALIEPKLTIANLTKHNEKENISHVKNIISNLEKRKEIPKMVLSEGNPQISGSGLPKDIHETETSSSEDTFSFKKKVKSYSKGSEVKGVVGGGSETGSEEPSTSEELSDIDMGPELQGDELMLGSHGFLDDELEGGEGYGDEIFSPEELLALAPGGRLPLSMQFETSLSTIEEVSVVSESTRTGGETDNDNVVAGRGDLDASVDSDGTVTSDTEDHRAMTQHKDSHHDQHQANHNVDDTGFPTSERPWYEMSDEEEGGPSTQLQIPRHRLKEHFTIF